MLIKRKDGDLCSSYRPQTFSDVVGQQAIVNSLRKAILSENHSQCYLFHGESGCGKTTIARILSMALNCTNRADNGDPCCECTSCKSIALDSNPDFKEINAADTGNKDDVRKIQHDLRSTPMFSKNKIYIMDEAHRMSEAAQDALLKNTEDMPSGVYVILCSTNPSKIIATLKNRCEDYFFDRLNSKEILSLIQTVGTLENYYPTDKVLEAIVENSDGRPRNALKALQKAINLSSSGEADIVSVLNSYMLIGEEGSDVIELCKSLTPFKGTPSWPEIVSKYKSVKIEPESIRIVIAGWFRSMLEKSKLDRQSDKYAEVLSLFTDMLPSPKPENKLVLNLYRAHQILFGKSYGNGYR
jgi:DNA polymerase-3 subunit gamma/tau